MSHLSLVVADSVMMVEPEEVEGPYPYQRITAAIITVQGSIIAKSLLLALGCIVNVVVDRRSFFQPMHCLMSHGQRN